MYVRSLCALLVQSIVGRLSVIIIMSCCAGIFRFYGDAELSFSSRQILFSILDMVHD